MTARPLGDRAVSETASVAVLLAMTLLVTASVGLGVVFIDADAHEGINANFTFDHHRERSTLVVKPTEGDALPAGKIEIQGRARSVTWAEVAGVPPNATVEPGGLPIQLSESSAWGTSVSTATEIEVYYAASEHNRTRLDSWSG